MLVLNVFTVVTLLQNNWKPLWYTANEIREAYFSGLRAAKHGNKFAQNGTVRDWGAVAAYRRHEG
jgi:hypothetical protein